MWWYSDVELAKLVFRWKIIVQILERTKRWTFWIHLHTIKNNNLVNLTIPFKNVFKCINYDSNKCAIKTSAVWIDVTLALLMQILDEYSRNHKTSKITSSNWNQRRKVI